LKTISRITNFKTNPQNPKHTEFTTSIHKSKGLEATCVLVVAKTNKELSEWLETDHSKRLADKNDMKRLGFVALVGKNGIIYSLFATIICRNEQTTELMLQLLINFRKNLFNKIESREMKSY